jgi:prepilin-type N-terminal cleavage/methylation domain-containing protein
MRRSPNGVAAFTLLELLTVIVLAAILIGIGYPTFISILEKARKTQAANDMSQIVTAVNAYYTEYGKYPVDVASGNKDAYFGSGAVPSTSLSYGNNGALFDVLRNNTSSTTISANVCPTVNLVTCLNPRGIVFIQPPISKSGTKGGVNSTTGVWYDPWGSPYNVAIDVNYNNIVCAPNYVDLAAATYVTPNPADGTGDVGVRIGVISWSFGKNGALGGGPAASGFSAEPGTANNLTNSGDVISWQ